MTNAKPTWILLRGLAREKGHWGSFFDQLKSGFPNNDVLAIDLPGAGEFRNIKSPQSVAGICDFVRSKALESVPGGSFLLLGVSLGGMVAMEWMRNHPKELQGCVLINTSSKAVSPFYNRLRWQIWHQFLQILATRSPRDREKAIIDLVMNNEESKAKALPSWSKLASEYPMSYLSAVSQLYAASRYPGLESAPEVPVLLLTGLGDRLVDPSCSMRLSERFHWPIERHPWAGHDLTWDAGDWVLEKILTWRNVAH